MVGDGRGSDDARALAVAAQRLFPQASEALRLTGATAQSNSHDEGSREAKGVPLALPELAGHGLMREAADVPVQPRHILSK